VNETPVAGGRTRPVQQLPEPNRFWITYSSRTWRCTARPYTDLANCRLAGFQKATLDHDLPDLDFEEVGDLLYLPPVDAELIPARDAFIERMAAERIRVLCQLRPGDAAPPPSAAVVYDLLEPLLKGAFDRLGELPEGAEAAWPLIPGLTDHLEAWEEGLDYLRIAKARGVQPLVPELAPTVRRTLAERYGDQAFDALFHGDTPSERSFAIAADRVGLEIFFGRPSTNLHPRQESNRQLASQLALAGELWHRLERPVAAGQGLLRAARGAESSHYDLAGLAKDNNLKIMDWLDVQSFEMIRQLVQAERSALLTTLQCEYLGKPVPAWVKEMTPPEKERAVKVIEVPVGDDDDDDDDKDLD
jgi:hypothetical protein